MCDHTASPIPSNTLLPTPSLLDQCSLSLAGLTFPAGSPHASIANIPRALFQWARSSGFRRVTLDGTMPTIRARELDRTGRRDLSSALRRVDLSFGGIDLLIPPNHLTNPIHQDRAFAAIREALDLAAELAALSGEGANPLVTVLAPPGLHDAALAAIAQQTDGTPSLLALMTWPAPTISPGSTKLGWSFDPSRVLAAGLDPAKELSRATSAPASLRMSDFDGISRCPIGKGTLDVLGFTIAASIAAPATGFILDCSGMPDCEAAIAAAR